MINHDRTLVNMPPRIGGAFVQSSRHVVAAPDAALMVCKYDLARFDPALFDTFNVPRDPALSTAVDKRQADYLAGRILAMQAMSTLGQTPVAPSRAASGAPVWPQGVRGSISHSQGIVGVWVTTGPTHVGLDIETRATARQTKAIRRIVLTDAERDMRLDEDALTAVFSAKEAIYKALYPIVGQRFGFECAELIAPPMASRAQFRLTGDLCGDLLAGTPLDVDFDWTDDQVMSRCSTPTRG